MHDIYDMHQDRKMNNTLFLLTVVTTFFIPASFIAGVYGMNFSYEPELNFDLSYPIFWVIVISMWVLMLAFFLYKGWFNVNT